MKQPRAGVRRRGATGARAWQTTTGPPTSAASTLKRRPGQRKRPVRIAVLGDFSAGAADGRLETGDDLARRKMIPVEFD